MSPAPRQPVRVLFVCLGNICRSPTAEGVFRRHVEEAGLSGRIEIDSAGIGDYHVGAPPDPRARDAASRRGYDLSGLRARQVRRQDFAEFDYVLAMDHENMHALARWCPMEHVHKLRLFTEFCPTGACPVPDPYTGGRQSFEVVLDMVEASSQGLLEHLRAQLRG